MVCAASTITQQTPCQVDIKKHANTAGSCIPQDHRVKRDVYDIAWHSVLISYVVWAQSHSHPGTPFAMVPVYDNHAHESVAGSSSFPAIMAALYDYANAPVVISYRTLHYHTHLYDYANAPVVISYRTLHYHTHLYDYATCMILRETLEGEEARGWGETREDYSNPETNTPPKNQINPACSPRHTGTREE